jgi:signal transduction histidine kinase
MIFLRDKSIFIALSASLSCLCAFFLYVASSNLYFALFIPCVFFIGSMLSLAPEYIMKNSFYREVNAILERLDEKHLLSEIITRPDFYDGRALYDVLKAASRSMNNEVAKHRLASDEYREYIEIWVHEIKTPIAGARLICENARNRELMTEIDRIEGFVEQALFYSRSSNLENDCVIKETDIEAVVNGALRAASRYLIARKIRVGTSGLGFKALTDAKWLGFIIGQIIGNSAKYGCRRIDICGLRGEGGASLLIRDDGIGIPEKDIARVFDKGFTGENGRAYGPSTGIGLYLCRKMCVKLGLDISIDSAPGGGATVELRFPGRASRP